MTQRKKTLMVSIGGVVAVALYAASAAIQILVLNPLAAAPGRSLAQIGTDMASANERIGAEGVFFVLGIGVLLAIVIGAIAVRSAAPPRLTLMLFLALLMLGAPGYFMASFGAGMGLADTYGIGGADYSPWAMPLYIVSAGSMVALVVAAIFSARPSAVTRPRAT